MTLHLQHVTLGELTELTKHTRVDTQVTHVPHLRELVLEVRVHVQLSLLSVLDSMPTTPLTLHLRQAIDDRKPFVYVT